jgi:hypothetical protein
VRGRTAAHSLPICRCFPTYIYKCTSISLSRALPLSLSHQTSGSHREGAAEPQPVATKGVSLDSDIGKRSLPVLIHERMNIDICIYIYKYIFFYIYHIYKHIYIYIYIYIPLSLSHQTGASHRETAAEPQPVATKGVSLESDVGFRYAMAPPHPTV